MNNLKNLRINKNYTAAQLSSLLGVGESVVCRWETGEKKPDLFHFILLCKTLDCKPGELFSSEYGNRQTLIPVLGSDRLVFTELPLNTSDFTMDFAVMLNEDISGRFNKGDICFFSFDCRNINTGDLALIFGKNNCNFVIFDNNITKSNVIAVCKFLKQRL